VASCVSTLKKERRSPLKGPVSNNVAAAAHLQTVRRLATGTVMQTAHHFQSDGKKPLQKQSPTPSISDGAT